MLSYNDNEIETIAFVSFLVKIAILTKTNAKTTFCFKFDMSANMRYCPALSRSMCPKHYRGPMRSSRSLQSFRFWIYRSTVITLHLSHGTAAAAALGLCPFCPAWWSLWSLVPVASSPLSSSPSCSSCKACRHSTKGSRLAWHHSLGLLWATMGYYGLLWATMGYYGLLGY